MTGTDLCVNKCKQSRSYLNHLVYSAQLIYLLALKFKTQVNTDTYLCFKYCIYRLIMVLKDCDM